ncbi:hypothetical protein [Vibrio harveyi]|uniref:hypothetical protein n=1 Tax=Vibrio harveyi TaxID=669 RepID=UPI000681C270|nr:hypothetical protein [Vibrio harveyi]
MQLAQHAVLDSAKALKLHRQQNPARYERVIEKGKQLWRYYSDTPTTLYGEFLLDQLEGDLKGRFLYAEMLENELWYMASFTPELEQEAIGSLVTLNHTFGYAIHHAEQFKVTSNEFHLTDDERCIVTSIPDKTTLADYELTLKPKSKFPIIALSLGLTLCLGAIGSIWMMQPAVTPKISDPVDTAKLLYQQSWSSKVNAHDALLSSRNLLVQTSLMPTGMTGNTVILEGQTLTLPIAKEKVTRAIEKAWQEATPHLAKHYQSFDRFTGNISLPLPILPDWQAYSVHGYRTTLIDALERLGAQVTKQQSQQIDGTAITTLFVETENASIGQVGIMADLLNTPFVVLSQLDMEMNEQYQLSRLNFTLDVQGD